MFLENVILLLQVLNFTSMLHKSCIEGNLEEWFAGIRKHVPDMEGRSRTATILSEKRMIHQWMCV